MRYLLIVNFEGGDVETPMEEWKPEEIQAHLDYYKALNHELTASGELVASEALAGPSLAKIVRGDGKSAPVVTDGPFQEFKEWLAGYQIVDVDSEARAIELAATTRWATEGVPERPSAWLVQTASRRMIDARRSEHARRRREERAALQDIPAPDVEARDDSLALLFMCCHPALSTTSAIALTLRAVAGLTTAEIAHA